MEKEIYLDYASTTPVDEDVFKEMVPYFTENYGNPSSIYFLGQRSLFAIDKARKIIGGFLNCKPEEIIFTGSATEANNLAILGLIRKIRDERGKINIITSKIEHDAVLKPISRLEKEGCSVTYLSVDKDGIVKLSELKNVIKDKTALISVMYANNEIGTIQPIKEIGKLIAEVNKKREPKEKIFFHTDAVQAINYLDCDVNLLKVDMLSFSGHKIYGPKGIGVLYAKRGTPLEPIILGGGQENGLRSGTENTAGIVGIGKAIELIKERKKDDKRISNFRDRIVKKVLNSVEGAKINGTLENRIPNNINFSFKGAEGESIIMALDQKRICASTGSACSSKSLEPSHVLTALGLSREEAHCSLRITLGKDTKEKEIKELLNVLPKIIEKLRKISGK